MEDTTSGEVAWVKSLVPWLSEVLGELNTSEQVIDVSAGYELAYTHEVIHYNWEDKPEGCSNKYQTDLLISDCCVNKTWWIPRVVIECKLGNVNTHTVQNYSTKAATHKNVHPYLRYGFLMAGIGDHIPARVVRHGVHFDFIAAVREKSLSKPERKAIASVLLREVRASRSLHGLFLDRTRARDRHWLVRRGLILK